ncbi:hypothetical protein INT48_002381 [Thamnidium elegans]|uniref:Uncharacterized protein n=1 Tax=Thamnidium elegans TaxID=101142 RepID=A0A8H7SUQ9_9FUNG|nr:hypothetical protein INT48_002381 [Thamnidium elegans]
MNFGLYIVIQYLENEQLNLQNNYARDIATFRDVQTSMLNFSEQLALVRDQLNGMQAILAVAANPVAQMMSNTVKALIVHLNNKIQDIQLIIEDITNDFIQVGEIDDIFLATEINNNILNVAKKCLIYITTSRDILLQISNIGPLYRQVLNQILQNIFTQLPNNTRLVINAAINYQTDVHNVNNMIERLNQNIVVTTNDNERAQLIQSRVVMVANIDIVNEMYQEFAVTNVDILNENITQNYLAQYIGLRIEQNCSALLQRLIGQSTAIETQLNSILQPFAEMFPAITTSIFWLHAYRKVCRNTINTSNSIVFEDFIQNDIDEFNVMRQIQDNGDGLYPIPVLDDLHVDK